MKVALTGVDENHYLVHYRSGYADPRLAQDFAIRRAAELTLQQDYEWFQIISRNSAFEDRVFDRHESQCSTIMTTTLRPPR